MNQATANDTSIWFDRKARMEPAKCPTCRQSYMGDGTEPCTECEAVGLEAGITYKPFYQEE